MGQVQIVRRRGPRRRAETAQPEPAPQRPALTEGARDEVCAGVLARIDEVTAEA